MTAESPVCNDAPPLTRKEVLLASLFVGLPAFAVLLAIGSNYLVR